MSTWHKLYMTTRTEFRILSALSFLGNPIKCDCSMAWLLRDQRQLLSKVRGGFCAGDLQLPFESTDDHNFTGCPLPCRLQHDGDQYDIICDNVSHEQVSLDHTLA